MKVREGAEETLRDRLLPPFLLYLLRSLPTSLLSPLFPYTCISIFLWPSSLSALYITDVARTESSGPAGGQPTYTTFWLLIICIYH